MMRRAAASALVALVCAGAATAADAPFTPDLVARGQYLAVAADCTGCHTAADGARFAGGYALVSPLGTIYSSNITPSRVQGIGGYTEAQFAGALRQGVRADGKHLYPAMPYTSYAKLSDADVRALYAYFMQAVVPVDRPTPSTDLPFPFNLRVLMGPWNALFLDEDRFATNPARGERWNRGAYLVEALGHCGECHTPRGLWMQPQADKTLGGGRIGAWYAPDITSDPARGIGAWKAQEIVGYLKTGRLDGKARAAGGMAEVVSHSLSQLSDDDLQAIALYLVPGQPALRLRGVTPATGWGRPLSSEAALRGASAPSEGASLYSGLCASCHGEAGQGTLDQVMPSLFHNSTVGADRADNLVAVILQGVDREAGGHHVVMPGFGEASYVQPLTDSQVAAVANHVRSSWGPHGAAPILDVDIALSRQSDHSSTLPLLAQLALTALAVIVLGLLAVWGQSRKHQQEERR